MDKADPERALALSYAPRPYRAAVEAVFELDNTLGQIVRTTREPLVGQMRLTWWYDALAALDTTPPPAHPVLHALFTEVLSRGVTGSRLAGMIDGWEALLDPEPLDRARLDSYAAGRGGTLFEIVGVVLGVPATDPLALAGEGWALADLAAHIREDSEAAETLALAAASLGIAARHHWSRSGRTLGAMMHCARMNRLVPRGAEPPIGAPGRVARLAWHRLTGR